jgi:hypothetical protein
MKGSCSLCWRAPRFQVSSRDGVSSFLLASSTVHQWDAPVPKVCHVACSSLLTADGRQGSSSEPSQWELWLLNTTRWKQTEFTHFGRGRVTLSVEPFSVGEHIVFLQTQAWKSCILVQKHCPSCRVGHGAILFPNVLGRVISTEIRIHRSALPNWRGTAVQWVRLREGHGGYGRRPCPPMGIQNV